MSLPLINALKYEKMNQERRKHRGSTVATNVRRLLPSEYIALNCPEECMEIITSYHVKPTSLDNYKGISERLKFIASTHEEVKQKLAEIHPDKALILKYCGKPAISEGDETTDDKKPAETKSETKSEVAPVTDWMSKNKPIIQGVLYGAGAVVAVAVLIKVFSPK